MKRFLFAALLVVSTAAAAENPFEGSWAMVTTMGDREIPATMVLTFDGETPGGVWRSQGMEMTLSEIEIDGDSIRFDRMVQGNRLSFSGKLAGDTISGDWSGAFGDLGCRGTREAGDADDDGSGVESEGAPFHDRPIVEEEGKRKLWAGETEEGVVEWFDMTDSTVDPHRFQYGIGKDTISSIDRPEFVSPEDPLLAARGVNTETPVLGVTINGISRAYPVAVMDMHEVVNDRFGDKAFAVLW